jgi:hypothetical protein
MDLFTNLGATVLGGLGGACVWCSLGCAPSRRRSSPACGVRSATARRSTIRHAELELGLLAMLDRLAGGYRGVTPGVPAGKEGV